ncbi:MAG: flotillin family protein [Candidatus Cloacimonetes bacterium]|nr:flotillin family protein [Candidatus Cloacimonadota bacterium]
MAFFGDINPALVGLIVFFVVLLFSVIIGAFTRYKKCPSDKILVIFGKIQKETSAKCIHGGAAFVWPLIQDFKYLDLKPMSIEVNLTNALSKQNIRVDVPSRFTVGISTEIGVMEKAAERVLGLTHREIIELSKDILFGQLRLVIATMDIEEINTDRDKFLINVSNNVEAELKKIGLKLINVNVTDIRDESGYIEALGKEAAAKAINDAKVSVAERTRDGSIGAADATKEENIQVSIATTLAERGVAEAESKKRIAVADADALAKIGEANAKKDEDISISRAESNAKQGMAAAESEKRIKVAELNATAIEGENISRIHIAESESEKNTKKSQADNRAIAAERIAVSEAEKLGYEAKKIAEKERAEMEKMTRKADIIVSAEIEKEKVEIEAAAIAQKERLIAQGKADARLKEMQAEALGLYQILEKKANGFQQLVNAAGDSSEMAIKMLLAEQMTELVGIQSKAISEMKIDQVTVWSNGKDDSSVSGYVHDLFKVLPPLKDILDMKGMGLPDFIAKNLQPDEKKKKVETEKIEDEVIDTDKDIF